MEKTKAIIVDIDGTLANVDHRRHFVEGEEKDWSSFFAAMKDDPLNNWCKTIMDLYGQYGYYIILVTGRPKKYKKDTLIWLAKYGIWNDALYMRPDENHDNDDEIKRRIYEERIEPFYDVDFVIDDRDKVVKMWREMGLVCLQCDYGAF